MKRCCLGLHLCYDSDCNLDNRVKVSGGCLRSDCCHGDRGEKGGCVWLLVSKRGSQMLDIKVFFLLLCMCALALVRMYIRERNQSNAFVFEREKHQALMRLKL